MHSFEFNASEWHKLKATYREMALRMPCCGVAAVPKSSPLGTHFFAHAKKGECRTAPESAEHIYCKNLIAQAAQTAGWTVTTERPGLTPDGEPWIADVFCENGSAKLALEVQMSPQTHEETVRRQQRYTASGVRGAWFYGPKGHKGTPAVDRKTPAFTMSSVEVGQAPAVEPFGVPLPEFVIGMLEKRLVWTVPEYDKPAHVEYFLDTCWKCNTEVKQVYGYLAELKDAEKWNWHERPFTVASISTDLAEVLQQVGNEKLEALGLNQITERKTVGGKATNWGFTNLCRHCRAPQNNFHVGQALRKKLFRMMPDTADAGYEAWDEERITTPSVGLASIARTVKGTGQWVFSN